MPDYAIVILAFIIPFTGTSLGSAMVFFLRDGLGNKLQKFLLGFASGVMLAASVLSLLIPAIEESHDYFGMGDSFSWFPAAIGFLLGIGFLLLIDTLTPHLHLNEDSPEGPKKAASHMGKKSMMFLAVTIHNIPEGMAVGVALAAAYFSNQMALVSALSLSIGIAIQNFPEGAIISLPMRNEGMSRGKSFAYGAASGAVEPLFGVVAFFITALITPILPYILSFAAGAMVYVVVEELIPEAQEKPHSNLPTIGVAVGFAIMMILDIALG